MPRNKFEQRILNELDLAGIEFKYEPEAFPYTLSKTYTPDFVIYTKTRKIYLECKGYLRPEHKAKMVAVKKQHPELDIRMLFYGHNNSNFNWAIKNGFKYAIGSIPEEWLNE